MNPGEARAWIAGRDILGMRFGTERIGALLGALGDPQRCVPALHVVGTNGKSSTARMAAAVLGAAGGPVGAYISPHIGDWRERIQLDGAPLDERAFAAAVTRVRAATDRLPLPPGDAVTQFEALTAAAFVAFRDAGVSAFVAEAGLGGRYDATNVLSPEAAVILTNVSLDHTQLLGDTEEAIAAEKLAVCPEGHTRLVIGAVSGRAARAIQAECARRHLVGERVGHDIAIARGDGGDLTVRTPRATYAGLHLRVAGAFQRDNLAAALAGAELVHGGPLPRDAVAAAIESFTMPGRLEWIAGRPPTLIDGAHNPAGAAALADALAGLGDSRHPRVAVMSVLVDKDLTHILAPLAPHIDMVIATRSHHDRARAPEDVAAGAAAAGLPARVEPDPVAALARARSAAGDDGLVVICGSLYLLVDLRSVAAADG